MATKTDVAFLVSGKNLSFKMIDGAAFVPIETIGSKLTGAYLEHKGVEHGDATKVYKTTGIKSIGMEHRVDGVFVNPLHHNHLKLS